MPLAPFVYGIVVGAAITYVAKDDPSKQMLKDTSGKVTGGIGSLTGKVTSIFSKSEAAAETADKDSTAAA
jgi:hypothetical protein